MSTGACPATAASGGRLSSTARRRTTGKGVGRGGLGGRRTHPEDVSVLGEVGGGPTAAESSAAELGWPRGKTDGGDDSLRSGTIPSAWRSSTARRSLWRSRLGSGRPTATAMCAAAMAASRLREEQRKEREGDGLGFEGEHHGLGLLHLTTRGGRSEEERGRATAVGGHGASGFPVRHSEEGERMAGGPTGQKFKYSPPFLFLILKTAGFSYLIGASTHVYKMCKNSYRLHLTSRFSTKIGEVK